VAAVVSNEEGIKTVRCVAGKVHIYVVKPEEAGRAMVSELPRASFKGLKLILLAIQYGHSLHLSER